jgi:hypothetical protein
MYIYYLPECGVDTPLKREKEEGKNWAMLIINI